MTIDWLSFSCGFAEGTVITACIFRISQLWGKNGLGNKMIEPTKEDFKKAREVLKNISIATLNMGDPIKPIALALAEGRREKKHMDKYHPIPGEMDTIDCLRKERDELKAEKEELEKQAKRDWNGSIIQQKNKEIFELKESLRREREKFEKIEDFVSHDPDCILNFREAGEPTPDGGYRSKYKGEWYQTQPIDKTPKCNCGLQEILESRQKDASE